MPDRGDKLLDLPFKGRRNYLHVTDIFPALDDLARVRFGSQAHVDTLIIRRPIRHAISVSFAPDALSVGSFRIRCGAETINGWLLESNQPVARRNPIDIPSVPKSVLSDPGVARLSKPIPGSDVLEMVVALMKCVLNQLTPGQWWLCEIHLDTPLTQLFPLEVRVRRNLGGRFLAFEIVQAGKMIGSTRAIFGESDS
jgi:hypothetical protein